MALTQPSFTVQYCIDVEDANFGKLVLQDVTDYASEGIANSDVIGYFTIQYPDGTFYQGNFTTPDIDGSVSFVFNTLGIPKDSNLDFLEGSYSFGYFIKVSGAVQAGKYGLGNQDYDFCPCAKPISTVAPLRAPKPSIEVLTNCFCRQIEVNELTNLCTPTTTSRVLTVYPPPSLGLAPYTVSSASLIYNMQYSGTYEILSNIALTYVTGIFTIKTRVKGSVFEPVNCDIDLCGIIECFNTYRTDTLTKAGQYGGFFNLPKSELDLWIRINGAIVAFDKNLQCSNWTEANAAYDELKTLLKCNCTCSEDDTPRLLNPYCTGSGSNGGTAVVAAGTGTSVTSVIVGSTTTYTVAVQQAIIDNVAENTTDIADNTANIANILAGTVGNNYRLIENDTSIVSTDANTSEKTLIQKTLTAGLLAADGGMLRIRGLWTVNQTAEIKYCRLYFGSSIALATPQNNLAGTQTRVEVIMEITRTSATTQRIETWIKQGGNPSYFEGFVPSNGSETLSGAILVKLTGQNSISSIDVASRRLTIEYFKKA